MESTYDVASSIEPLRQLLTQQRVEEAVLKSVANLIASSPYCLHEAARRKRKLAEASPAS